MPTYKVTVSTGNQFYAGTYNYVYLTLEGNKYVSDRTLLNNSLFKWFSRGWEQSFEINVENDLGDDLMVRLDKERFIFSDQWFCRYVKVNTPSGIDIQFPCYRWITNKMKVVLRDGKGRLPQYDENKEYRQKELLETQSSFSWIDWNPVFPKIIAGTELPLDIQFDTKKAMEFDLNFIKGRVNLELNVFKRWVQPPWKSTEDFKEIFLSIKDKVSDVTEYVMHHWKEDSLFAYQFLNGCNPVMIRKYKDQLPQGFAVTHEMVENFLERGLTLQEEITAGNIYIADYEILDRVEPNDTDPNTEQFLTAPFCMFYKNNQNDIIPIAIQLTRHSDPEKENQVFLPKEHPYDWLLAKMWVKSCDANVHQLDTHLLKTHLISEVIAIAMFRQLAKVHPIYKLLIPHVRFTIAINTAARENLINESGIYNKVMSTGGKGVNKLMQKAMERLDFRSLCFPESIQDRGVDKADLPKHYYYRDDGLMVWDAIKRFVSEVVEIYYKTDADVENDEEIQAFVQDVCTGLKKDPKTSDFPISLETRSDLVTYLTVVIFTASAQHSAVNFGQFDWFAWIPNSPFSMRKPPPTEKGKVDMKYIMESLPDREHSAWQLAITWTLSQFEEEEVFLQSKYVDHYFTEDPVLTAIRNFNMELTKINDMIRIRNKLPYNYLSPDRIPNSVAV